jgi:hypothetical protein
MINKNSEIFKTNTETVSLLKKKEIVMEKEFNVPEQVGESKKREIKNADDLLALANTPSLWNEKFVVTTDIDMSGVSFTPIGNVKTPFTGSFDGQGNEIRNLKIDCPQMQHVGFFGLTDVPANIEYVSLVDCDITGADGVGGICGFNQGGKIENCLVFGSVGATELFDAVGDIVGANCDNGIVSNNNGVIGDILIGYDAVVKGKVYKEKEDEDDEDEEEEDSLDLADAKDYLRIYFETDDISFAKGKEELMANSIRRADSDEEVEWIKNGWMWFDEDSDGWYYSSEGEKRRNENIAKSGLEGMPRIIHL